MVRLATTAALVLSLVGVSVEAYAIAWPDEAQWKALARNGTPMGDVLNDGTNERDLVGDTNQPVSYIYQNDTYLYFRLRVDQDPRFGNGSFRGFGWGCAIDTDNNSSAYEFLASVDGINGGNDNAFTDAVRWQWNQMPEGTSALGDRAEVSVGTWNASEYARVTAVASNFGGDADFFIDWAIPVATIRNPPMASGAPALAAGAPMRVACGTANDARQMDSDPAGFNGAGGTWSDVIGDPVVCGDSGCTSCDVAAACGASCVACTGATPACSPGGTCVRCTSDGNCPAGATCAANTCVVSAPVITLPTAGSSTNISTPTIQGTGVVGATVTVSIDGAAAGTTTVNGAGQWSLVPASSLSVGMHTVVATATVGAGQLAATSSPSVSVAFSVVSGCVANGDCGGAAPYCNTSNNTCVRCLDSNQCPAGAACTNNACVLAAPVVANPANGATINDPTPTITGTAVPDAQVDVIVDGASVGVVTASGGGWSIDVMSSLMTGTHTVTATARLGTAPLSVTSPPSSTVTFTLVSGCLVDGDCPAATPRCNASTNACVRCLVDGHCPTGATCGGNTCSIGAPTINAPTEAQVTNDATPTVSGTAQAGATVNVYVDGVSVGATVATGGSFSLEVPTSLMQGAHTVFVTQTVGDSPLSVTSPASSTVSFTVTTGCLGDGECTNPSTPRCNAMTNLCVRCVTDGHCPAGATCVASSCSLPAPVITAPTDGSKSNDNTPTVTGTAVPLTTIDVRFDGASIGMTTTNANGAWSFTPNMGLVAGDYVITATATADTGPLAVTSAPSASVTLSLVTGCLVGADCPSDKPVCDTISNTCNRCLVTHDCPAGAMCSAQQCVLAAPVVTAPTAGSTINDDTPTIAGTAIAGATIVIRIDGNVVGMTSAPAGTFTFDVPNALASGAHTVTAVAVVGADALAVTSPASAGVTFQVVSGCLSNGECAAPAPVCDVAANACVRCLADGDCPATATCANKQCVLNAPIITAPANDTVTNALRPTVSGTAPVGATVTIRVGGTAVGTAVVDGAGMFTFMWPVDAAPGTLVVTTTASVGQDALAVASAPSSPVNLTIVAGCLGTDDCADGKPVCNTSSNLCVRCLMDVHCPPGATCGGETCVLAAPVIASPTTGTTTNVGTPTLSGTAVPGASVTLLVDGVGVGTAQADGGGLWTFTLPMALAVGGHVFTARSSVGAGVLAVVSGPSAPVQVTLVAGCTGPGDCIAPTGQCNTGTGLCVACLVVEHCPMGAMCTDGACTVAVPLVSAPAAGSTLNVRRPVIRGTAVPGSTVTALVDGTVVGTATAGNDGSWMVTPDADLAFGSHTVTAQAAVGMVGSVVRSGVSAAVGFEIVMGCLTDGECSAATPLCDLDDHMCVRCRVSPDCPGSATCTQARTCVLAAPTITTPSPGSIGQPAVISGTAPAGATVTITIDGQMVGTVEANGQGVFTFTAPTLMPGTHSVSATARVGQGALTVTSQPSTPIAFVVPNPNADRDGDGLTDGVEQMRGSDPDDADTDDDGVPDGEEKDPWADTDGDGVPNVRDPDSDGDGIKDGTEQGVTMPGPGTNVGNGHFVPDEDPTTTTDPLKPDSDGDGVPDGTEDMDRDGRVEAGERNPGGPDVVAPPACTTDADCGHATSGMVCEPTARVCQPGCRAAQGNGCPGAVVCTAQGAEVGLCDYERQTSIAGGGCGLAPVRGSRGDGIVVVLAFAFMAWVHRRPRARRSCEGNPETRAARDGSRDNRASRRMMVRALGMRRSPHACCSQAAPVRLRGDRARLHRQH